MRFDKFVSAILPSFEKKVVAKDIDAIRTELVRDTLPVFEEAATFFVNRQFKAKEINAFNKAFTSEVKLDKRGNFLVVINHVLKSLPAKLDVVEKYFDRFFADDVTAAGLTYLKANVLQYIEVISFTLRYSRKLLLWTYACETNETTKSPQRGSELLKVELDWLRANSSSFYQAMKVLGIQAKDLERHLKDIPDIVIDPETVDVVSRTQGMKRIDPLALGAIPRLHLLGYYVGEVWAEMQVSNYNKSLEEKRALEFRLMNMKLVESGERDAKLEQNIQYSEDRLQKLNRKIQQMEEDYG